PFGIDAPGLIQMVYRLYGKELPRTIEGQSKEGEVLSFIEESVQGDLAFFDNSEGELIHVGIMLEDHHIIHSCGKVRIDRIDHTGIFNREEKRYTHQLRMIKKVI
ncbi:MAG: C40 family peptidase, partial [Bacteroidia bacterium]|nr:C40 family peptidase [Bacteroidia bacterium]